MTMSVIRLDKSPNGVAEVVLQNPDKLNAMAPAFFTELRQAFETADADPEIRAVVLWAEGRIFTAGLDLKAAVGLLQSAGPSPAAGNYELFRRVEDLQAAINSVEKCRKPVIAAVHGHCIGGGVDLTTACDVIVATADATFAIHETKIAIVADLGTLQRITRWVGRGVAREMAFTGRRLTADRALRAGLVAEVFPEKEALLAGARAMAAEIAANSPITVQGVKSVLNFSDEHSIEEGQRFVALWNSAFLHSKDLTEAVGAFMQKRPPSFKGH